MIAVVFALPQESRAFICGLRAVRVAALAGAVLGRVGGQEVLVAHVGVGGLRASRQLAAVLAVYRPALVISAGFAGGLDPRLEVGSLLVATNAATAGRLTLCRAWADRRNGPVWFGPLTTQPVAVESVADKARLAQATGALAVDMESAALAEVCRQEAVEFFALRVISDGAQTALPVPMAAWFDLERQRPKALALLVYLLRFPGQIAPFAGFVRGLGPARRALGAALLEFIAAEPAADEPAAGAVS